MIVFAVPYSRPPAWLGMLAGSLFIVYITYRVHRDWRDLTGWELGMSLLLVLMGGILLFDGLTDLFRH